MEIVFPNLRFVGVLRKAKVLRPTLFEEMSYFDAKTMVFRVVPNSKQSKEPLEAIIAPAKQKYPFGTLAPAIVAIRPAARGRVHNT
jgi:hypothetical protein